MKRIGLMIALVGLIAFTSARAWAAGGVAASTTCGLTSGSLLAANSNRHSLFCQNQGSGPGACYLCTGVGAANCTSVIGMLLNPGQSTPVGWMGATMSTQLAAGGVTGVPLTDVECICESASQNFSCTEY